MGGGGSKKEEVGVSTYDEKKRTMAAKEIVETERTYVRNLQTMCKVFLNPLKEAAETPLPILTSNEIKEIFGIIEVIVNFHATLFEELDERMKKWSPSICLGDIFAKNNAFFKMISTYVNGYNQALMTYHQLKQKGKSFAQFLDKCVTSGATNMLDLQSFLIMPVQRLPRYVLLLTELVKYSNVKHATYPSLCQSLEAVKGVADFVNEAKRNAENSLKMLQIQENLVGKRARPILEPTRKFYSEGTFTWLNSRKKEPRPLQYILFHDSLLLATPEKSFFQSTPDKLKLKVLEPLVSLELQESMDKNGTVTPTFDIQTSNKVFTVVCGEDIDAGEWIKLIYWLRSGCGPRYEKVNAEAQKRHYRKSDTLEQIRPQKKKEGPTNGTLPRAPTATITTTDNKQEAKKETKPDSKPEPKPEPKPDPKPDSKPDSKPEPKPDPKPEPPDAKKAVKSDLKNDPKNDSKTDIKSDPKKNDIKDIKDEKDTKTTSSFSFFGGGNNVEAKPEPKQADKGSLKNSTDSIKPPLKSSTDSLKNSSDSTKPPLKSSIDSTKPSIKLSSDSTKVPPAAKDIPKSPPAKDAPKSPPPAKDAPKSPPAKDAPKSPPAKDAPKSPPPAKDAPKSPPSPPVKSTSKPAPPPPAAKGKIVDAPKPPRPKSPPPPKKAPAPLSSTSSSSSPSSTASERRPSLTTSISSFFGINGPSQTIPPKDTSPASAPAKK